MNSNADSDIDVAVKPVGDESRCTKVYSKRVYRKSRRCHGNQHSNKAKKKTTTDRKSIVTEDARKSTISGKKIMDITAPKYTQNIDGYRLIDM